MYHGRISSIRLVGNGWLKVRCRVQTRYQKWFSSDELAVLVASLCDCRRPDARIIKTLDSDNKQSNALTSWCSCLMMMRRMESGRTNKRIKLPTMTVRTTEALIILYHRCCPIHFSLENLHIHYMDPSQLVVVLSVLQELRYWFSQKERKSGCWRLPRLYMDNNSIRSLAKKEKRC